ncbi:MAG: hypothetical protein K2Q01_09590 [Rickettsiales bacterium]|nr:hypothetical protein [Rickettsiales bacterium]
MANEANTTPAAPVSQASEADIQTLANMALGSGDLTAMKAAAGAIGSTQNADLAALLAQLQSKISDAEKAAPVVAAAAADKKETGALVATDTSMAAATTGTQPTAVAANETGASVATTVPGTGAVAAAAVSTGKESLTVASSKEDETKALLEKLKLEQRSGGMAIGGTKPLSA